LKELIYVLGDWGLNGLPWFIVPISLEFHITDVVTGEDVGSVVQKSKYRITKDEWSLLSKGEMVGKFMPIKYYVHGIICPRRYEIVTREGRTIGLFEQHRNVSNFKYSMMITDRCIDTRLLVSAGIIIATLKTTF